MTPLKRAREGQGNDRRSRLRIYATLPKQSAYVGNFSHAPSAGKTAFFDSEITRVEELERLHRIRAHPFTGNFHSRPGHYSKLHGLAKFRDEQDDGMREPAQRKRILDRIRSTLTEPSAASSGPDAAAGIMVAPNQVSWRPSAAGGSAWAAAAAAAAAANGNGRGPPNGYAGGEDELIGATTTMLRHFYHLPNGGDVGGGGVPREQGAVPSAEAAAAAAMRWAARGGPSPRVAAMAAAARSRDSHNHNPMAQPKHGRGYGNVPAAATSAAAPPNGSFAPPVSRGGIGLRASIGPGCRAAGSSGAGSHGWESHTVQAQQKTDAFLTQREQLAPDMRPSIVLEKEVSDSYDVDLSEEGRLGRGAYSDVHAAVHRATGRPVAIKAIQKRYLFSDAEKAAVEREISLQQRLVHEHIARLYETYDTPDHLYLVMERAPLGTLEELLFVRGRMPELEAKRVAKQVLEAVAFCHNAGVVHCDLKPANVLLADALFPADSTLSPRGGGSSSFASSTAAGKAADEEGRAAAAAAATRRSMVAAGEALSVVGAVVKICDFGHSRKVPDVRYYKYTNDINRIPFHLFKHTGTEGFVAPEILDAEPYGKPADLWSVGVILAVMLVGRLPFAGTRASQRQQQRPAQQLEGPLWRGVSAEAKSLVGALLELDPDSRPTAADALRHVWFDQVDHCVVLPLPPRQRSTSGGASDVEYVPPRRRGSSVASKDTGRR